MKIEDIKERKVFNVPEGYFEQLEKDILSATSEKHSNAPRNRHVVLGRYSRILGYAAAIAVIFVLASNIFQSNEHTEGGTAHDIAAVEEEYATNEYIDNILNSYPIDEYTFYCYVTDSDFD